MADGAKLKKILENKGKSVRWLSKETTISPTTIYSIIQRDTNIRYDFALRMANVLEIDVKEICSDANMTEEDWDDESNITLPVLEEGLGSILDGNRVKRYLKYTLYPLMSLFGSHNMPIVDRHLTSYYMLTDEGRKAVDKFIEYQLTIEKDDERAKDIRTITHW